MALQQDLHGTLPEGPAATPRPLERTSKALTALLPRCPGASTPTPQFLLASLPLDDMGPGAAFRAADCGGSGCGGGGDGEEGDGVELEAEDDEGEAAGAGTAAEGPTGPGGAPAEGEALPATGASGRVLGEPAHGGMCACKPLQA